MKYTLSVRYIGFLVSCISLLLISGCGADKDRQLQESYEKASAERSVMENLRYREEFSTLVGLLEAAGLSSVLEDIQVPLTLFAPSNDAFQKLPQETLDELASNPEKLRQILQYHVVMDEELNLFRVLKSAGKALTTIQGDKLFFNREKQRGFVNGIEIDVADIKSTNGVVHGVTSVLPFVDSQTVTLSQIKTSILELAESYKGIEDVDSAIQLQFDPLLAQLFSKVSVEPIRDRISILARPWRQVWGPYEYGSGQSGVDPSVSPDEIFQVISNDGYYYNVTPLTNSDTGALQVGLLRGEYEFDPADSTCLRVQFIEFPGVSGIPSQPLWTLPSLEVAGTLEQETGLDRIEIVPKWIVASFFGGGTLCEIYTDNDLRIAISVEDGEPDRNKFYVLVPVD